MEEYCEKGSTLIINEKELTVIVINKDERNHSDNDAIQGAINLLRDRL